MERQSITTLADMPAKSRCIIVKVHGHGGLRHRILELGFVRGETVDVLKNAPLQDPIEYQIMGSHVSLRRSEAENYDYSSQIPAVYLLESLARRVHNRPNE